jgi:hypothetical protein
MPCAHAEGAARRLLQQPPAKATPVTATTPKPAAAAGSKTCYSCKCVIPSKPTGSGSMVGLPAPMYATKNICANGAGLARDQVCTRNMGSWTALYEC